VFLNILNHLSVNHHYNNIDEGCAINLHVPSPPPPLPKYLIDRTQLELIILYFIIHRGKEMMCLHSVPARNIINRRDNDFNRARNIYKKYICVYKISSGDVSLFAAVVNRDLFFPSTTCICGTGNKFTSVRHATDGGGSATVI